MREYLYGAGVRPINNIVDITNFVMLETGQPMHAFDLFEGEGSDDRRAQGAARARHSRRWTARITCWTRSMLVIADAENATGLAGIMGGEESEIVGDTASVLFESAAFERANNRITARKLGVRTEASGRFEKGVNPDGCRDALERACMLVNMLECGSVVPGVLRRISRANRAEARLRRRSMRICRTKRRRGAPAKRWKTILNRLNIDTDARWATR